MGNTYSEARLDHEARALLLGQTAEDLQRFSDLEYCNEVLKNSVTLLHSVFFPENFTFKGNKMTKGEKSCGKIARYYIQVALCLAAAVRVTNPSYLVNDQLIHWKQYKGGGILLGFENLDYFLKDNYNSKTGAYELGRHKLDDESELQIAFRERSRVLNLFTDILAFPLDLDSKVADFRKSLIEFEPLEKKLDLLLEKLKFNLSVRRIYSLQKI